ncbi:hypothetical protein SUGI_1001210 [Cryptomeria japonica]|nr:hypothetical protein SUGI_1001210 [Cryptomeria japonica]
MVALDSLSCGDEDSLHIARDVIQEICSIKILNLGNNGSRYTTNVIAGFGNHSEPEAISVDIKHFEVGIEEIY